MQSAEDTKERERNGEFFKRIIGRLFLDQTFHNEFVEFSRMKLSFGDKLD